MRENNSGAVSDSGIDSGSHHHHNAAVLMKKNKLMWMSNACLSLEIA